MVSLSSLSTFLEAGVVLCNTAAAGAGDFGEVIPPERKVVFGYEDRSKGGKGKIEKDLRFKHQPSTVTAQRQLCYFPHIEPPSERVFSAGPVAKRSTHLPRTTNHVLELGFHRSWGRCLFLYIGLPWMSTFQYTRRCT